ncbi:hypothetical protein EVAR_25537_1 [Eumeta japonica]|uniref:Uncharacterized protein n=1 Tax=Eumeta variegata TaxID=151549 RepID=A0A4C1VM31_EUMVA|nr:hypothetical protein EVAR_25537_1 [Eumeta japonica]
MANGRLLMDPGLQRSRTRVRGVRGCGISRKSTGFSSSRSAQTSPIHFRASPHRVWLLPSPVCLGSNLARISAEWRDRSGNFCVAHANDRDIELQFSGEHHRVGFDGANLNLFRSPQSLTWASALLVSASSAEADCPENIRTTSSANA